MTWVECLCLSVPPSAALAASAWRLSRAIRVAAKTAADARNWVDCVADLAGHVATAADTLARAHVKAARYSSRAIKVTPRPEDPPKPTVFQDWMEQDGRRKSAQARDAVEAAMAFILGEDSGSEMGDAASLEGARGIVVEHAGTAWYAACVEAAKRR